MPDSGDLREVESTPRQDTQVRVFAMPPREDASSSEIVTGFLEALTSDDPNFEIARKYLTPQASAKWRPLRSTTVLADGPGVNADRVGGREDASSISYTLNGTRVATVDGRQSYRPGAGDYRETMHLARDRKTKQWRIDVPPRGVVMGKSDFQRNYLSVEKFYFATDTAPAPATSPRTVAVADPVYVRRNVAPVTEMVRSLLNGPTSWLDPVVRSSFPTGTALAGNAPALAPDDQNRLTVPLNAKAARVGLTQCREMASQLLFTLENLTPAVDTIELRAGGRQLCTEDRSEAVAARGPDKRADYLYLLDADHRLVRLPTAASDSTEPDPVPGALGTGATKLRTAAVSRDEAMAAGVGADGKNLYVGALVAGGPLGDPELTSAGPAPDKRLSAPSWDARGDLWVADRDPGNSRVLMLKEGVGEPLEVSTPAGLEGTVQSVRVAADGVRVALVVRQGEKSSLLIGRIERGDGGTGGGTAVSVRELRSATPELEVVTAMSWAGDSRLVVVGREKGGVQTMRYVQVDGSTPDGPAPAALSGVKDITASEDVRLPLVGFSEDGIVRLPSGEQWQKVVADGSAPIYPG
ncbi:lipoprotein LpqB [Streptomyces zinciresistens K42]|uniref:Lipoprotein LpqB n=2 Tax=Streptomyces TaxID=1883 RepID=G2GIS5_9ACTN|nr:LpqB family beta-propeller domain-containing protein [Streptomyces zinciresistens]EGX56590.1 lipoprotein LpqB [Streptomyces zinciresistens K42]